MKATIQLELEIDPGTRPGTRWNRIERVARLVAASAGRIRHVQSVGTVHVESDDEDTSGSLRVGTQSPLTEATP